MYITEYKEVASAETSLQVPQEPPLAIQVITFTASVASAALNAETKFVSIQLDTNGHIQFGTAPTATVTTSRKHEANAVSFHGVPVGASYKIAAIDAV
jgi:hypothetical protein